MTKLLKGAEVAAEIHASVMERVAALKARGIVPCIAVVRVGARQDDIAYEKSARTRCEKLGIAMRVFPLAENCSQQALLDVISEINNDCSIHGCLLFRPLPKHIDEELIRNALLPEKDVDGITDGSLAGVFTGTHRGYPPCTAQACVRILTHYGVELTGKHVVVLGRSLVVGRPAALMLLEKNATVTVCHTGSRNPAEECRKANVLIAAAGRAGLVTREYLAAGQTVVDVGIHVTAEGSLCGDVNAVDADGLVDAITPVPGGVGTVTTALLMEHIVCAAEKAAQI